MTLIINLKSSTFYSSVSPENIDLINEFLNFLNTRFYAEEIKFYFNYPNDIEGENIHNRTVELNSDIKELLSFSVIRGFLNNNNNNKDFREYLDKLRRINIKIIGRLQIGKESYPAYIMINDGRLSKIYGSLLLDIYSSKKYYNFFELIKDKDPYFIDDLAKFLINPENKVKEVIKSCFIINDNSEKEFPFNAAYLYYDSPIGYVNDGFIEIYKEKSVNTNHLTPVKSFLTRKIAINPSFRDYLFQEGKSVGVLAKGGSLSIKVIKEDALEKIYKNIYKKIDPFIKELPDESFFEKEIEKRFKLPT